MDDRRFDDWTRFFSSSSSGREVAKAVAGARSRRRAIAGLLAGALAAVVGGQARATNRRHPRKHAGNGGHRRRGSAACAHFCKGVFPPGPERGKCTSTAAHGNGPCHKCDADPHRFCDGRCVDLETDPNHCGECGNRCAAPAVCHQGACCTAATPEEVCCDYGCDRRDAGCGVVVDCGRFWCDGDGPHQYCRGVGVCCLSPDGPVLVDDIVCKQFVC